MFIIAVLALFNTSSDNLRTCETSVQEAPLHQELHPPQPLLLLHPEGRGRVGEGRHPLQPNVAVLQPAVTGEVATSVAPVSISYFTT